MLLEGCLLVAVARSGPGASGGLSSFVLLSWSASFPFFLFFLVFGRRPKNRFPSDFGRGRHVPAPGTGGTSGHCWGADPRTGFSGIPCVRRPFIALSRPTVPTVYAPTAAIIPDLDTAFLTLARSRNVVHYGPVDLGGYSVDSNARHRC